MVFFDTGIEAITIVLKDSQISTSISTIYIPLVSLINTTLLNNLKSSGDKIIITGDLNVKHTDFNCSKTDKYAIALKMLYAILIYCSEQHTYSSGQWNQHKRCHLLCNLLRGYLRQYPKSFFK